MCNMTVASLFLPKQGQNKTDSTICIIFVQVVIENLPFLKAKNYNYSNVLGAVIPQKTHLTI